MVILVMVILVMVILAMVTLAGRSPTKRFSSASRLAITMDRRW
jgi:hypothetical protein